MDTYFDSHVHLASPEFAADLDAVLDRARAQGVRRFLVPGGDMQENRRVLELAQRSQDVFTAVGVHPNALAEADSNWRNELQAMLSSGSVHAIGETGLDLYRKKTSLEDQIQALFFHLELGAEHGLPVVIHQRAAVDEMVRALREFSLKGGAVRGVLHCYSGDCGYLQNVLAYDLFISFAGPITYPRNRRLRELIPSIPEDRLLIETDAPYLPTQSHRGERNEPAFIPDVASKVAEGLRILTSDVARITWRNTHRLLNLEIPDDKPAVVYQIRNSLYINLTNRCNCHCVYCPSADGRYEIRGHNLRLEAEPSASEVISAVRDALASADCKEIVFCGLGEPTMRFDALLEVASALKVGLPLRLDTNGLVALYHGPDAPSRLAAVLDAVSVSLNTADPAQYRDLCRPEKEGAFEAAVEFTKAMRDAGLDVTITAVKFPGVDTARVLALARELGVGARLRELVR